MGHIVAHILLVVGEFDSCREIGPGNLSQTSFY